MTPFLRGHIIDYNIKMSAIVMPESTTSYLPFYDKITDLMGGKAHVVHYESNIMDFFVNLNDAFANVTSSERHYNDTLSLLQLPRTMFSATSAHEFGTQLGVLHIELLTENSS